MATKPDKIERMAQAYENYLETVQLYRDTSLEAYGSVLPFIPSLHGRVIDALARARKASADEIEEIEELRHQTVTARLVELEKARITVMTLQQRPTRSGRMAFLWMLRKDYDPAVDGPLAPKRKRRIKLPWSCATCHHNMDAQSGIALDRESRTICTHPDAVDANKGAYMMTPWPFGCSLYQKIAPSTLPAPPGVD